jgi:hypothetical protein
MTDLEKLKQTEIYKVMLHQIKQARPTLAKRAHKVLPRKEGTVFFVSESLEWEIVLDRKENTQMFKVYRLEKGFGRYWVCDIVPEIVRNNLGDYSRRRATVVDEEFS